ncbi:MAG TPA: hypothetical protein PLL10_09040 [Elusimicrobiales bacterium]|nr:hypothetical protein [Elusimicrobiales bacterium]
MTTEMVVETLSMNTSKAKALLSAVVPELPARKVSCQCRVGMANSLLSAKEVIPAALKKKLSLILE